MQRWKIRVHVTKETVKVWVRTATDEELARATLPMRPGNRQALATLLRGLAMWAGGPQRIVTSAAGPLDGSLVSDLFDAALWPTEEPLLQLTFLERPAPRRQHGGAERGVRGTVPSQRRAR